MTRFLIALSLTFLLSLVGAVMASSLTIIAYEQSDRTALIPEALVYSNGIINGKTGIDGAYNLTYEQVPPSIRVAKAGFSDWTGTPAANDTLVLAPMTIRNATYIVEVLDADTLLPVGEATVEAVGIDMDRIAAVTDGTGRAVLPLRTEQVYNLQITAPLFQAERDTIVTGFENLSGQYSLSRSDRISIRVADAADGNPVSAATVFVNGVASGETNERGILITSLPRSQEHLVEATAPGYDTAKIAKYIGPEEQVLDLLLNRQHTTVFVSAFDPDKKPIPGVTVTVDGTAKGETNEYGRLMVSGLAIEEYSFSLSRDGYETAVRTVTPGPDTGEIIVELTPVKMPVMILVTDNSGRPVANASLFLDGSGAGYTDGEGRFPVQITYGSVREVTAGKTGYTTNSSPVNGSAENLTLMLQTAVVSGESRSLAVPPAWILGACAIIAVLILLAMVFSKRLRAGSRNKRKIRRKRSL